MEYDDIIEREFGHLMVKQYVGRDTVGKQKRIRHLYECKCKCGKRKVIERTNLLTDHTTSCGCLKRRMGAANPSWEGHGEISGRFFGHIKSQAVERNLSFSISISDAWDQFIKQDRKCALTGLPLSIVMVKTDGYYKYDERTASLDRIDNMKGYEKDNIWWVHKDVNWMKGKFDLTRFRELCRMVTDYAA